MGKSTFVRISCCLTGMILSCIVLGNLADIQAKEGYILQCEFAGVLFDRLEIADKSVVLTKEQKIRALEDLRFAPDEGYQVGEPLKRDDLVTVLLRVYALESELPAPHTMDQAFDLLVSKKILREEDKLEVYVLYIRAVEIVQLIEPIRSYKPGLILLPRVPVDPDASPVE